MTTSRRDFMLTTAATLGTAAIPLSARAQTRRSTRKMIIRCDDVGQSKICNIGTFEAIDGGMIGAADVMLDSPGTEDALERLRYYPWISIGWHMHMWGAPVSDRARVPSLIEKGGEFDGRFRTDLSQGPDVSYEEALTELRAQVARCIRILGKAPETSGTGNDRTPWGRAVAVVVDEFGMANGFSSTQPTPPAYQKHIDEARTRGEEWAKYYPAKASPLQPAAPKWQPRKITSIGTAAFIDQLTDSVSAVEKNYDAVRYYTEDRAGILTSPPDTIWWQAWHPGYVDYYVYRQGERVNRARAQQFVVSRTQDVHAMTSPILRKWIKENNIELINFRDALYGTRTFQNHLAAIGSDLAV